MGSTATYLCQQCGLSANVSGGSDRGMGAATETVWCGHCKVLQDVASAVCDSRAYRSAGSVWRDVPLRCAHCEREVVQKWHRKLPCPSCGGTIDIDPGGEFMMWD